ncbi:MAG TPA: hypothetical protein VF618_26125 [Thermoanaerobaculia bacterium]
MHRGLPRTAVYAVNDDGERGARRRNTRVTRRSHGQLDRHNIRQHSSEKYSR